MIWLFSRKSANLSECIEEAFFRTMLVVGIFGCAIGLLIDVLLTESFDYKIWLRMLLIQVLVLALYAMRTFLFKYVATAGLFAVDVLITYRGIVYDEYDAATCALLITLGFICSLITKGRIRSLLKLVVLVSLLLILFKKRTDTDVLVLMQMAIPYLISYFIVTISSGLLKDRYEKNQKRLTELVELLNQKNAKINNQHNRLLKSYKDLARLNENLEEIVVEKTSTIEQKNRQLAELAFANAHRVRGPLARILGLLHLIDIDKTQKENYIRKINDEAMQMDDILRLVGRSIEKNMMER